MRRFGYLDRNPNNSEALYHESAIVEALKNIQKYGALEQTGKLDGDTMEVCNPNTRRRAADQKQLITHASRLLTSLCVYVCAF